ncbi:MAG: hypothetical protein ACYDB7_07030 [Mycobacteriales bacterium]
MSAFPPEGGPGRSDGDLPLDFVVPDDISELEAEIEALRRERAAELRQHRLQRLLLTRWLREHGLSGAAGVAALVVVALCGGLLTLLGPGGTQPLTPPVPLASPTVPAGSIGGLLPVAMLRTHGRPLASRDLPRPALLVLLPPQCQCGPAVQQIANQAAELAVTLVFVSSGTDESLADQYTTASPDYALPAVDPAGVLAATYRAGGQITLVFVRTDGVVTDVLRGFRPGERLETRLDVVQGTPSA